MSTSTVSPPATNDGSCRYIAAELAKIAEMRIEGRFAWARYRINELRDCRRGLAEFEAAMALARTNG